MQIWQYTNFPLNTSKQRIYDKKMYVGMITQKAFAEKPIFVNEWLNDQKMFKCLKSLTTKSPTIAITKYILEKRVAFFFKRAKLQTSQ